MRKKIHVKRFFFNLQELNNLRVIVLSSVFKSKEFMALAMNSCLNNVDYSLLRGAISDARLNVHRLLNSKEVRTSYNKE